MENLTRVLVVDDNKNITAKIEKQFSSHAVIEVVKVINNGKDALDYIINHKNEYDIICMDIILPEIDGLTILERMKQENIKKKVIILTSYKNNDSYGGITKEIYPEVAIRFSTTASRVERAIRHAIEVSWNRGDYDLMEEIFGNSVAFERAKPTNSEFIATIADRLRYDKKLLQV